MIQFFGRMGGGAVSPSTSVERKRDKRFGRRAPFSLCGSHTGQAEGGHFLCLEPGWRCCVPSRFIDELPDAHVDTKIKHHPAIQPTTTLKWTQGGHGVFNASSFQVAQTVSHPKFGTGKIVLISGDHLEIEFEYAGRKKVLASFVKGS